MNKTTHPYFVPNDTQGNRRDTAALLVGTATEFNIPQREVATTQDGFRISENVAKALGWTDEDGDGEVDPAQSDPRTAQGQTVFDAQPDAESSDDVLVDGDDEDNVLADPEDEVAPYDEWEYNDLKAEIARRGLDTEDQKAATLAAALTADDAAVDAEPSDDDTL